MDFAERPRTKRENLCGRRTRQVDHSDPYDLLRKAKKLFEEYDGVGFDEWLEEYDRLPGATLSPEEVHVLMCSQLRCEHNAETVRKLWGLGLFKEVSIVSGPGKTRHFIRVNSIAKDALRLRGVGVHCCGHDKCAA